MTGLPDNGHEKLDELQENEAAAQADEGRRAVRSSFMIRLAGLVAVVVVVGIFGGGYVVLNTMQDLLHTMVAMSRQTRACVTPGTPCYTERVKQDKAQTTAIVAGVSGGTNEVSIWAAWCAVKHADDPTATAYQACVNKHLHPR
jgi:fructoselysine-6-P-deglycase FrlB-like protein